MKTKHISKQILLLWVLCIPFGSIAQQPYKGNVKVNFQGNTQNRETVTLKAGIDLTNVQLGTNEIITFTPALRSLDGEEEIRFETIHISGKKRAKSIRRQAYYERQPSSSSGNFIITGKRKPVQSIPVNITFPFRQWMLHSQMIIIEETAGCTNCLLYYAGNNDYKLYIDNPLLFPEPYQPNYKIIYRAAPREEIKILRETYSAQLNFHVNQTKLVWNFSNNARVLAEADRIINQVKNDTLLTIRKIIIQGYASPEGNARSNQQLSEGRAQAFVDYLQNSHHFHQANQIITAEGLGEDWAGLRKAVEAREYFRDREKILDILDNTVNAERRKSALKQLSAGRTYKIMLTELYPPLRRNEYTIEYEVRGFNAEEAKIIFQTRPQLLSLEEMFMVANQYEHNSEEYKQVFDVAGRLFPESSISQFNVAALEIENGSYDTAIRRLQNIDSSDTLNNLGIAWWCKGEYDLSRTYFERAIEAGSPEAKHNLSEFKKWLETYDE